MKKRINSLCLIAGAVLFFFLGVYLRNFFVQDYTKLSSRIAGDTRAALESSGISESNLIRQFSEEKRKKNRLWVETTLDLTLSADQLTGYPEKLTGQLKKQFKNYGVTVRLLPRKDDSFRQIIIEKGKMVLLKINWQPLRPDKKVALVIDDIGYNRNDIKAFLELGIPLNFAVLPGTPYGTNLAGELVREGHLILLHQPLEPLDYPQSNPGPSALFVKMKPAEIQKIFRKNLAAVPVARGVSSHMGSRFTADQKALSYLLPLVKAKGLFFLDSYTTADSRVAREAGKVGLSCLVNDIFLDRERMPETIKDKIKELTEQVEQSGKVIAIGHVQNPQLAGLLKVVLPELRRRGIQFVRLDELITESKR